MPQLLFSQMKRPSLLSIFGIWRWNVKNLSKSRDFIQGKMFRISLYYWSF